ncbi:MAG: M23 family metallopeptidase [Ignavibacteriae bacterium]|nr:M23 family metallopeptidase [Ignavibacteriota bacterium]
MSSEGNRRKKRPRSYKVIVVPSENAGSPRTWETTTRKLAMLGVAVFFAVAFVTVLLLGYTPIGWYVPIQNPELEQRYGRQIVETQERLNTLAEQVMVLRDYNTQLRKALGEQGVRDTSAARNASNTYASREPVTSNRVRIDAESAPIPWGAQVEYGDQDPAYNVVVTNSEGFRGAFPLLQPAEGFVTQGFDPTRSHYGIDYATQRGTPVYASTDGYVVFSGWTYEDGNVIILSHGGGYLTVYKHNQTLLKSVHTFVKRSELIALVGTSGKTSGGSHLHFEVWKDGMPLDPNEFLLTSIKRQ